MTTDSRWFRLPETGDGSAGNDIRPDFRGHEDQVEGWVGSAAHPNGAPHWVVRVEADTATLDDLGSEPQVIEFDGDPETALNQMFGQSRTVGEWATAFGANS